MSSHWSTYMVPLDRLGISSFFGSFLLLQYLCFNISVDGMMHIHFWGCLRAEQTFEYTPPEALLNASWYHGPKGTTVKYVNLRYKSIWKLACMVYILRIFTFLQSCVCIFICWIYFIWIAGLIITFTWQVWYVECWRCDVRVDLRITKCISNKFLNTCSFRSACSGLEWRLKRAGI